jgi:hypothetical protein
MITHRKAVRAMLRMFPLALLLAFGSGFPALATNLDVAVEAAGCQSGSVAIGPGCATPYRVVGELSDAESDGLALVAFDLEFSGGALLPAETPIDTPMMNFAPPAGLSNPSGFGGWAAGGKLVQVGGAQNLLVHGAWDCETDADCPGGSTCDAEICSVVPGLPLGTVVRGVAQPGARQVLVTGSLVAPMTPGTYTLALSNLTANVLEKNAFGLPHWQNVTAGAGTLVGLTITVEPGADCCDIYESCCMPSGACLGAPPAECYASGGVPQGTDPVCEGDGDGDGVDVTCGDLCPYDPNKTHPGACGCGMAETDNDNDGTPDCVDGCPNDPDKIAPGECGCGVADTDSDSDGTPDCNDDCPNDPDKTEPGVCGCGVADDDSDDDTVPDCNDLCPNWDDTIDEDGDGVPDCVGSGGVPATSEWGVIVLILLLMAVSTYFLLRRRPA